LIRLKKRNLFCGLDDAIPTFWFSGSIRAMKFLTTNYGYGKIDLKEKVDPTLYFFFMSVGCWKL